MVGLCKNLDVIVVARATLVVVSALAPEPTASAHRSLRARVLERATQLYRPALECSSVDSPAQVVLAASPRSGPGALTLAAVSYDWSPLRAVSESPALDVLHMAVSTWRPDSPESRWGSFAAAFATANRLAGLTHR